MLYSDDCVFRIIYSWLNSGDDSNFVLFTGSEVDQTMPKK